MAMRGNRLFYKKGKSYKLYGMKEYGGRS